MTQLELTSDHWSLLNTCGSVALRDAVREGRLPDHTLVNAQIAKRCLWENPAAWSWGRWFQATYGESQFRNGTVHVRRVDCPDGKIVFHVAGPSGRWCDSLDETAAKKHLLAHRVNGRVAYLDEAAAAEAERDYNWALSR